MCKEHVKYVKYVSLQSRGMPHNGHSNCTVNSGMSKSLLIYKLLLSFKFPLLSPSLTLPNIFISSLLPSDISIALLLPRRLRGALEHMCV